MAYDENQKQQGYDNEKSGEKVEKKMDARNQRHRTEKDNTDVRQKKGKWAKHAEDRCWLVELNDDQDVAHEHDLRRQWVEHR